MLRRLEAMLAVADREHSLVITGNGDVLEPEQGIVAIGRRRLRAVGGALLIENTELVPRKSSKARIHRRRPVHLHQSPPPSKCWIEANA